MLKARPLLEGYWKEDRDAVTGGAIATRLEIVSQRHLGGKRIINRCRAYPCIVQHVHITVPIINVNVEPGLS